jgi:hypothetical protein
MTTLDTTGRTGKAFDSHSHFFRLLMLPSPLTAPSVSLVDHTSHRWSFHACTSIVAEDPILSKAFANWFIASSYLNAIKSSSVGSLLFPPYPVSAQIAGPEKLLITSHLT